LVWFTHERRREVVNPQTRKCSPRKVVREKLRKKEGGECEKSEALK